MHLDNRRLKALPSLLLRNHFFIEINNVRFTYCYIRKNASSSFKKLFRDYSPHQSYTQNYPRQIDFLKKEHGALSPLVRRRSDATIAVLRDPLSRSVSHFVNKVVVKKNARDFTHNYEKVTDLSLDESTFREFVTRYLNQPWWRLDLHVWPQASQLWPIFYTHVLFSDNLVSGISELLGKSIAENYFSVPVNASERGKSLGVNSILDRPAGELAKLIKDFDINTDLENAAHNQLGSTLELIYAQDYKLLDRIRR